MSVRSFAELTFEELGRLDHAVTVVIVPVGATEAHGPHLPLSTDVIIAEAMARAGAERISAAGKTALVAPPLADTSAGYAAGFSGTISLRPELATLMSMLLVWPKTRSVSSPP